MSMHYSYIFSNDIFEDKQIFNIFATYFQNILSFPELLSASYY